MRLACRSLIALVASATIRPTAATAQATYLTVRRPPTLQHQDQ